MTDFSQLLVADRGQKAAEIHLVDKDSFDDWAKRRPASERVLLAAHRFDGKTAGATVILPNGDELVVAAAVKSAGSLGPWCLARLAESLPDGEYRLADGNPGDAALGWTKHAPYDVIVLTGSTPVLPQQLLQQMKPGARLFAVVGEPPVMAARLVTCTGEGSYNSIDFLETSIAPLTNAPAGERFSF